MLKWKGKKVLSNDNLEWQFDLKHLERTKYENY
jgi:hypothetical protein